MALIKCPECGNMTSDKAASCPHCGCPIEHFWTAQNAQGEAKPQKADTDAPETKPDIQAILDDVKRQKKENSVRSKIVIFFVLLILVALFSLNWKGGNRKPSASASTTSSSSGISTPSYSKTPESSKPPESTTTTEPVAVPTETTGQRNAVKAAKRYLPVGDFSRSKLIDQLKYEGFSAEDAEYGVDNCGANWNQEAVDSAAAYLKLFGFSSQRLTEQLQYDGFTQSQIEYALSQNGY